ncbi:MAG: ABC transporter permease [Candidatus Competibacteraceae bacterium]|nr:ABC transporter permease [Candidatus Competibacteraceae bacterium]
MSTYIVRRILVSIPMLIGITLIIFVLANLMPGDAVTAMMATEASVSRETIQQWRQNLGLDQSMPVRYVLWARSLLSGNLGYSYSSYQPVASLIARRILPTLELMGLSLLLSVVIGTVLGIISAVKQYSVLDYVLTVFGFLGRSVPVFFVGMLLIYFFRSPAAFCSLFREWKPPEKHQAWQTRSGISHFR